VVGLQSAGRGEERVVVECRSDSLWGPAEVLYGRRAGERGAGNKPTDCACGPCTITNDGNVQAASTGAASITSSHSTVTRTWYALAVHAGAAVECGSAAITAAELVASRLHWRLLAQVASAPPAFRYRRQFARMTQTVQAVHAVT
jgi:hypothetical protein